MKTTLTTTTVWLLALAALVACESKHVPASGPLGELPGLVIEQEEAEESLKSGLYQAKDDESKMKEQLTQWAAKQKEIKDKIAQAGQLLTGKQVPAHVAQDVPLQLSQPLTVTTVTSGGTVRMETAAVLLDDWGHVPGKGAMRFYELRYVVTDAEGNAFHPRGIIALHPGAIGNTVVKKGDSITLKLNLSIEPWEAEKMASMKSITIVNSKSSLCKQAEQADKQAKAAAKAKDPKK